MTRERIRPELLAVLAAGWLLGLTLAGVGEALAYLAPALLLGLPLMAGRYPGERPLVRALAGRRRARPRRAPLCAPPGARPTVLIPRGGRLVAAALAGRGPPGAAPHATA